MPTRKKDRGPSLDTLNLEVDKKTDFYGTVLKDLASVDPMDRRAYQKRVNEKKLKLKIKEKEAEAAKKHKGPTVSISAPVDSDEEFEGVENYEESEENSDDSSDSSDSSDKDEDEQKSKEENKNTQKSNQAPFGGQGKHVGGEQHLCTWYETWARDSQTHLFL